MMNINEMAKGYPYFYYDTDMKHFVVGLDPVTHLRLSHKDIAFIIEKYKQYLDTTEDVAKLKYKNKQLTIELTKLKTKMALMSPTDLSKEGAVVPNRTGDDKMDVWKCPICNHSLMNIYDSEKPNYCSKCGQILDWDDAAHRGTIVKA